MARPGLKSHLRERENASPKGSNNLGMAQSKIKSVSSSSVLLGLQGWAQHLQQDNLQGGENLHSTQLAKRDADDTTQLAPGHGQDEAEGQGRDLLTRHEHSDWRDHQQVQGMPEVPQQAAEGAHDHPLHTLTFLEESRNRLVLAKWKPLHGHSRLLLQLHWGCPPTDRHTCKHNHQAHKKQHYLLWDHGDTHQWQSATIHQCRVWWLHQEIQHHTHHVVPCWILNPVVPTPPAVKWTGWKSSPNSQGAYHQMQRNQWWHLPCIVRPQKHSQGQRHWLTNATINGKTHTDTTTHLWSTTQTCQHWHWNCPHQADGLQKQAEDILRQSRQPLKPIQAGDAFRVAMSQGWRPAEYREWHQLSNSHVIMAGDQARLYQCNRNS